MIPRRPTVIAGRLPSKKPLSLMIATSAPRRSRLASSHASRWTRARLLLALEDVADVDREATARREDGRGRHQVEVDLALVVGGAAAEHPPSVHDRLERRRRPEVQRVDRLDVVVAVDQDGRRALGMQPIAVDDGMAGRLGDLDVLEADPSHRIRQPLGGASAVDGMRRDAGDARDPEELLVRGDPRLVGRIEVRFERVGLGGGVRHRASLAAAGRRRWTRNRTSGPSPARSRVQVWMEAGSGRLRVRLGDRLAWPDDGRDAMLVQSFGGRSLKRASKPSESTVSSATSFSARATSLSLWVVRTSVARS